VGGGARDDRGSLGLGLGVLGLALVVRIRRRIR
jgi:MYXO-CTERM domain-containing protein